MREKQISNMTENQRTFLLRESYPPLPPKKKMFIITIDEVGDFNAAGVALSSLEVAEVVGVAATAGVLTPVLRYTRASNIDNS